VFTIILFVTTSEVPYMKQATDVIVSCSWFLRSGEVREKSENQKKSWIFTFQSQGKFRGSGKVSEFKSTRVQKLTKMQKKRNCCTHAAYNSFKIFLLALLVDYLYFRF